GMNRVENLVGKRLGGAGYCLRQSVVSIIDGRGAKGISQYGDIALGCRLTKRYRDLILTNRAYQIACSFQAGLNASCIDSCNRDGVEELGRGNFQALGFYCSSKGCCQ